MKSETDRSFGVLFSCIGRRVSLLKSFRAAAKQLKLNVCLIGTDATNLSPALQLCDSKCIVRPIKDPRYLRQLLQIVKQNRVKLLVPTIDTDLILLAKNRHKFAKLGCRVLISEQKIVDICQDKRKTHDFLAGNGLATPETISPRTALSRKRLSWPKMLKPWDGAASKGVTIVHNRKELAIFSRLIPNCIVQDFIEGTEFTCDVYVDFEMKIRCIVPRQRIETRAGEVSKGKVVKNRPLMDKCAEVMQALGAGPGVITLQAIVTTGGQISFIEINPRFGGGAPLAIKAGANFPKWILQELIGQKPQIKFDGFKDGLTMLRYDAEVWI